MQLEVKCDGILACTLPAQLKPSPRPRATRGHHPLIIDLRLTAGVSAKPGPHPFIQSSPTVTREKLITRTIQELQWCRSHVLGSDRPGSQAMISGFRETTPLLHCLPNQFSTQPTVLIIQRHPAD
ncbi:hypothetical protein RRG08_061130 [Elysia crispata]|uniref:Uncharacterized protein n=1 Tax=Elysia crispata TaxID=231223 RepID=A0AAE1CEG7_9GAST|nr:hypothetical protein RRG08_061130 [Elysia crispata]